jgi:hypothetical protein
MRTVLEDSDDAFFQYSPQKLFYISSEAAALPKRQSPWPLFFILAAPEVRRTYNYFLQRFYQPKLR